jgi:hypothetical protein
VKDLNYSEMVNTWKYHQELIKYPFILNAWIGKNDQVEYGLMHDRETTTKVLTVMKAHGYCCSIVEKLLNTTAHESKE